MSRNTAELPDFLALLPDSTAAKYLTRSVRTGQEEPPRVALLRASTPPEERSARWATYPVRELMDEAMRRFGDDSRTRADAWLAPRLHATIRMTRAEASDTGLWNFLALVVAPDYVVWRHLGKGKADGEPAEVAARRFSGRHDTQTFARLWWAAELFRNGDDYRTAEIACGNQDVLNTVLRLDIMDHRPSARAVVRLLERGTVRTGREVNALATAINSAGTTLFYDGMAPDEDPELDGLWEWIRDIETAPPAPWESLPDGPKDGRIPESSVTTMVRCFEGLFAEAPVRGRAEPHGTAVKPIPSQGVSLDKPYASSGW
ncbi:DUF6339 family protein [Streptomyces sp. MNU89]|uniref:DUF6339 family protein n=1 Tax=Streptomyces sp. MNU89 TaxID=2560025 RepID=UPI001E5B37E3|nr:DUF6339 family protein [Streptomyces sp. MNU89]MCC9741304.1 DUF6339 family protein [Streptomyces sp. MNU89]